VAAARRRGPEGIIGKRKPNAVWAGGVLELEARVTSAVWSVVDVLDPEPPGGLGSIPLLECDNKRTIHLYDLLCKRAFSSRRVVEFRNENEHRVGPE
jgi:hypothetical protein